MAKIANFGKKMPENKLLKKSLMNFSKNGWNPW